MSQTVNAVDPASLDASASANDPGGLAHGHAAAGAAQLAPPRRGPAATAELEVKNRELARKTAWPTWAMAWNVAHEVRNNLVPVTLYLSMLRRRMGTTRKASTCWKATPGSCMDVMVNDLLLHPRRDPNWPVSPSGQASWPTCRPRWPRSSPHKKFASNSRFLRSRPCGPIAKCSAARSSISGSWINALDVMPQGGTLTVSATASPRGTELHMPIADRACPRMSCRGSSSHSSPPNSPARVGVGHCLADCRGPRRHRHGRQQLPRRCGLFAEVPLPRVTAGSSQEAA